MTAKRQAELVAKRLRTAADAPVVADSQAEVIPALVGAGAHAATMPTWDLPHLAGRLDSRRRVSLHALDACPDAETFDATFEGPFVVLVPSSTGSHRGRCGVENRPRNGAAHRRLRLSVAVTERLQVGPGDLVLVFADLDNGHLVVTAPTVLAAAAIARGSESVS